MAGRSPYSTESKSAAVPSTRCALPGVRGADGDRDLVRGRAGEVVEAAALDLADGERAEAVDHRVRVAALGQRPLGAVAQLGGGDRLVGEHRVAGRAATRAVRRARDSSSPSPATSSRNATIAANVDSGGSVGRGVDGAVDEPVEPVEQLLDEVAVVVLRA